MRLLTAEAHDDGPFRTLRILVERLLTIPLETTLYLISAFEQTLAELLLVVGRPTPSQCAVRPLPPPTVSVAVRGALPLRLCRRVPAASFPAAPPSIANLPCHRLAAPSLAAAHECARVVLLPAAAAYKHTTGRERRRRSS